jgi:hypothetical protein
MPECSPQFQGTPQSKSAANPAWRGDFLQVWIPSSQSDVAQFPAKFTRRQRFSASKTCANPSL